jgi:hypothetical protein
MTKTKTPPLPKTLGACADRLLAIRQRKADLQRQLDELDAERSRLNNHLIEQLPRQGSSGIAGRLAEATIEKKPVPTVKDWKKLYAFILKTKDFSFLHKSVAAAAVKDRWEANQVVPGVEKFTAVTVSVTAVKK